jgi:hypothetical protein
MGSPDSVNFLAVAIATTAFGTATIVVGITGGNCMQLGVGSIRCSRMVS